MELNRFQKEAVNEPPKNITVSAAAGSGKTQVLGARVLRRISGENPVDVNRLLSVTFTKAAAAEMRSRISRSISDALRSETDSRKRRNLERQLSLLGGADICTVDSFCYRLLKQNFFRVPGLSGDFSVGSEGSVRDISSDAMRCCVEMFCAALEARRGGMLIPSYEAKAKEFCALYPEEEKAEKILEGFALLAENYGSAKRTNDFFSPDKARRSTDYVGFVRKIKWALDSAPDPEALLDLYAREYCPDITFDETCLGDFAAKEAGTLLDDIKKKLLSELENGGLNTSNRATFEKTLENLDAVDRPKTYSDGAAVFSAPFPSGGKVSSKDTKKEPGNPHAAAVMDGVKALWKNGAGIFKIGAGEIDIFRKKLYPAVLALCELTRCVLRLEREEMLEKKRLSFSLCVRLTLEMLTGPGGGPSELAGELRHYYDEIYVDEAQDIDPRQLAIFKAISEEKLFMVGDVKQSIYGFRHAEPELFNSRCVDGENSRLISMNQNYRSNEIVIAAVNLAFSRLMNMQTMNIDYAKGHEMVHGESWLSPAPAAEFIAVVDSERYAKYKFDLEAQVIADRINELISSKTPVYDKDSGSTRPIEYRDIIVLLRTNKDIPVLEKILTDSNVPCYSDAGEGLFSREEISAVMDILTLIDNPLRDIPLAAALRGLMFGFGENDLLEIRAVTPRVPFSAVFYALSREDQPSHEKSAERLGNPELLKRCLQVGELMEKWRSAAAFRPISEVINLIITDTGFYSAVGALPSGVKRRANLDLLTDMADSFEADGSKGLFGFIDYVRRQELSGGGNETEAKTLSDAMNVVRLMTIHKSKGLEAPAVIIARCSAETRSASEGFAINTELGFSCDYLNEDKGYRYKSPLSPLIQLAGRVRERAEEIRLLYVAMTRPRELLICTGYFYNQKPLELAETFDTDYTPSDITFLAGSYAKMLGSTVPGGRMADSGARPVWKRIVISADEVKPPAFSEKLKNAQGFSENIIENMNNLLGFSYEYAAARNIPAKVSVSELKAADYDENAAPTKYSGAEDKTLRRPSFIDKSQTITGTMLGSAYHAVMENLDFALPPSPQIDQMAEKGIISPELRNLIKDERISALVDSPLGRRMRSAKRLWREAPFMINIPAAEVLGREDAPDETVAVQGVIDCFFEDENGITVIDYKTDVYSEPSELVEKYKTQLMYYTKAIKMKFSDKKVQKYLYLFYKGDIIEVV